MEVSASARSFSALAAPQCGRQQSELLFYTVEFPPLIFFPGWRLVALLAALAVVVALLLTAWSEWLDSCGLTQDEFLMYISIPAVSTVFTYFHTWAALYMIFYPLKFAGCGQIRGTNFGLGWQGIVPARLEKMARMSVELMTEKVVNVRDVFERIDPAMVAGELDPVLQSTLSHVIEEVALAQEPAIWQAMPSTVKGELVQKAREDAPSVVGALMAEATQNIESVFDLPDMVVKAFMRDPELMNLMFIECGYVELRIIRDCGAYMGLLFGTTQMVLWVFFQAGWMLPAFGLVVGMLSNWVALKMIFEPVEPVHLLGGRVRLQGLFLQRQAAVSDTYAKIVATHILSTKYLIPAILTGRRSDKLIEMVTKHLSAACDNYVGVTKYAITMVRGTEQYSRCKKMVEERLVRELPEFGRHLEKAIDQAMDLETLISTKLREMPSTDFEQLLHPVFQEDEWKLVVLGGALGVLIGCCQWAAFGA